MTAQPSIQRKTRKELLSEWRHAEVLDAAGRIFAARGYSATNVEEIAKEAGMAKGTIYLYFKSKEEIFAEVLGRDLQALTDRTIEAMSAAEMFSGRVKIFLNLRLEYLRSKQNFLRIYLDEFASRSARPKPVADAMDKMFRRDLEFMQWCVVRAMARDEIRQVPAEAAAYAIFDLARGFVQRHLNGWTPLTLEEDVAFVHSMILNGLQKDKSAEEMAAH